MGALADNLKAVTINKEDIGAFSEGGEFLPLLVILSLSWAIAVLGETCPFLTGNIAEAQHVQSSESSEDEVLEESLIAMPSLESVRKKRLSLVRERVASYSHTDFDCWPFISERWFPFFSTVSDPNI